MAVCNGEEVGVGGVGCVGVEERYVGEERHESAR
jgi:hypothetical protein